MKKIILIFLVLVLAVSPVFANNQFGDVRSDMWYSDWVNIIKELNITSGYPDGTFRPDNQLKRIELLSFTMKSIGRDIQVANGYWGQNIIDQAVLEKIITSDPTDLMFSEPNGFVTREETARVIYNAYLKNNSKVDIAIDKAVRIKIVDFDNIGVQYIDGVVGVIASGIVEGYTDKTFKPNKTITRAEASVFISRLALADKRVIVDFSTPTLIYVGKDEYLDVSFTLHYEEEHNDIVNLTKLIYNTENKDVENGYANMNYNEYQSLLNVTLYPDESSYFDLSAIETIESMQWAITSKLTPPDYKYDDWITISTWRKQGDLDRTDTIITVFDYLFESYSTTAWNTFMKHYNAIPVVGGNVSERLKINGREFLIVNDSIGLRLCVSRKLNVEPLQLQGE